MLTILFQGCHPNTGVFLWYSKGSICLRGCTCSLVIRIVAPIALTGKWYNSAAPGCVENSVFLDTELVPSQAISILPLTKVQSSNLAVIVRSYLTSKLTSRLPYCMFKPSASKFRSRRRLTRFQIVGGISYFGSPVARLRKRNRPESSAPYSGST